MEEGVRGLYQRWNNPDLYGRRRGNIHDRRRGDEETTLNLAPVRAFRGSDFGAMPMFGAFDYEPATSLVFISSDLAFDSRCLHEM